MDIYLVAAVAGEETIPMAAAATKQLADKLAGEFLGRIKNLELHCGPDDDFDEVYERYLKDKEFAKKVSGFSVTTMKIFEDEVE